MAVTAFQNLSKRSLMVSLFALAVLPVVAAAAPNVFWIGGNVSPTPVYFTAPQPQWMVPGSDLTNGTIVDSVGTFTQYIAPSFLGSPAGAMTWISDLDTDLNPGGPIARGTFKPGGTLQIVGSAYNEFMVPIFNGVLLQAVVSGFEIAESNSNLNQLNLEGIATITPISGALVDGSVPGLMQMVGDYYLDITIANAQQAGGNVIDFQSDIFSVSSLQFQLVQVPEPGSLCLMGVLAGLLVRRRRNR